METFFISLLNKIISVLLVPVLMHCMTPVLLVKKIIYRPFDLISISESGYEQMADEMHITAHRGVTAVAPENTLPAYEEAVKLGYYSAECDIKLTSDNKWVLSHSDDIDKHFWQFGKIAETDFDSLRTYAYKNGTNFWKYKDLKIPTLEEFLDVFVGSNTRPQIEIKVQNYDMLGTVVDAVRAKGLEKQAIIISFDIEQLKAIRAIDKNIELWYLVDEITNEKTAEAKALGNTWLSANFSKNNEDSIRNAADSGVDVSYWTVNTLEDAKMLYDLGVRYIETDMLVK